MAHITNMTQSTLITRGWHNASMCMTNGRKKVMEMNGLHQFRIRLMPKWQNYLSSASVLCQTQKNAIVYLGVETLEGDRIV